VHSVEFQFKTIVVFRRNNNSNIYCIIYIYITWSVTLREEHRLRVFENRVLRGVFGSKRDGVTGEWRRLHNEELYDLY
jgi:hypothetical protein